MDDEDEILTGILVRELTAVLQSDQGVDAPKTGSLQAANDGGRDEIQSDEELNSALDRFCEILGAELGDAEFAEAEALISRIGTYEDKTWARGEAA
ncbi:hypothetical protein [Mesorhizobium sp. A623]